MRLHERRVDSSAMLSLMLLLTLTY